MKRSKIDYLIAFFSVIMFAYHMIYTQYLIQGTHRHAITHLGLALLILFLTSVRQSKSKIGKVIFSGFAIAVVLASVYLWLFTDELILRTWFPTSIDLVVGVILLVSCTVACYKNYGLVVPIIAWIFVLYPFFGKHLPEPFYSISYNIPRTINNLTTSLSGGLFDVPLGISSRYLFLVVMLGFVLNGLGATQFFQLLAKKYGYRIRSGAGMMAVVSSAGVGSVVGCGAANTAITGSFTIPTMLREGYKPEFAAAVEASASIGGQLLPPIMGFIAFVMVGYTGIPYRTVCAMALVPALLYFFFVGLHVHLYCLKNNYGTPEKVELTSEENKTIFRSVLLFLIPFTLLIILITIGLSVMYSIFWSIVALFVASMIAKKTRPSLDTVIDSIVEGAQNGASIAVMCATVGLIITSLNMSGMGVKLTSGIETWSGGNLLIGLLIIVVISIIMGTTGVATAAYILVAIFAVPALERLGLDHLVAHFFAMYPTVFTFITPPVALAVLVGSRLAGADYIKSGIEACRVACSGFLLSFLFVYAPILLLRKPNTLQEGILDLISCIACLFAIQIGNVGYLFTHSPWIERFIWFGSGALLFSFVVTKNVVFMVIGLLLLLVSLIMNKRQKNIPGSTFSG